MTLIKHDQYMISLFILYQTEVLSTDIYVLYIYVCGFINKVHGGTGSLIFHQFYDWNFLELEKDL